jgi:hypothetical protein
MSSRRNKKSSSKSSKSSSKSRSRSATPSRSNNKDELPQGFLPSEILNAIEIAKKNNKSKYGDEAFNLNIDRAKPYKNAEGQETRYFPFEIDLKGTGEFMPLYIKFQGVKTEAGIKPPEKRNFGLALTFKRSTTFVRKDRKTGEDIVEPYGEARFACAEAFSRIAKRLVKTKVLRNGKKTGVTETGIQRQAKEDPKNPNSEMIDLEDPFFRPSLNVSKKTGEIDVMQGIRDLRKKIPKEKRSRGQLPYELAKDDEGVPLNPENIHNFFRMATPCFGVHNLSQGCCSQSGISCPSNIVLLMAKKPQGRKPTFDKFFNEEEMEEWGGVEAYEEGSEGGDDEANGSDNEEGDAGEYGDIMDAVDGSEGDDIEDPASEENLDGSGSGTEEGSVDDEDLDSNE